MTQKIIILVPDPELSDNANFLGYAPNPQLPVHCNLETSGPFFCELFYRKPSRTDGLTEDLIIEKKHAH